MSAATIPRAVRLRERTAYHQAGHAVVATAFGFRYGMLSLHPELATETERSGPLGIDLWKCAFPSGQTDRLLQVLTMLWAGTAAEVRLADRRVTLAADPDRAEVERFAAFVAARGHDVSEHLMHRGRLDAASLLRLPQYLAAAQTVAAALLADELLGAFTTRGMILDVLHIASRSQRLATGG